jgi:hypothetical protein
MRTYSRAAIGALVMTGALSILPFSRDVVVRPAFAVCMPGDRIDGTTANDALRRFSSAGYPSVHDLKKGCDNYWHGIAMQNGTSFRVVLSPSGEVMREGD